MCLYALPSLLEINTIQCTVYSYRDRNHPVYMVYSWILGARNHSVCPCTLRVTNHSVWPCTLRQKPFRDRNYSLYSCTLRQKPFSVIMYSYPARNHSVYSCRPTLRQKPLSVIMHYYRDGNQSVHFHVLFKRETIQYTHTLIRDRNHLLSSFSVFMHFREKPFSIIMHS